MTPSDFAQGMRTMAYECSVLALAAERRGRRADFQRLTAWARFLIEATRSQIEFANAANATTTPAAPLANDSANGSANGSERACENAAKALANASSTCVSSSMNDVETPPKASKSKSTRKMRDYSAIPGFDAFWSSYPNGRSKHPSAKAWAALSESDRERAAKDVAKRLRTGGEWASLISEGKRQFIPHGSTYLNQRRWEDEDRGAADPKPGARALTDEEFKAAEAREAIRREEMIESLRKVKIGND